MKTIVAPYTSVGSDQKLASIGSVSSDERARVKARNAIALEGYIAPESRIKTAITYAAGAVWAFLALAMYACSGPTDSDALRADALSLQDAQVAAVQAAGARK